jgi:hypothetical protein
MPNFKIPACPEPSMVQGRQGRQTILKGMSKSKGTKEKSYSSNEWFRF